MSFTIDDLVACHERAGLKFRRDDERQLVESLHSGHNGTYRLICTIDASQSFLTTLTPQLAKVTEQGRVACLEALLAINYSLVLGRFSYDLRDGEVTFRAGLPLEDGDVTQAQFEHLLRAVLGTVDRYATTLPEIVWGNVSPQDAIAHAEQPAGH